MIIEDFTKQSLHYKTAYVVLWLSVALIIIGANPFQLFFINDDFIHIPMAKGGYLGHHNKLRYINDLSLFLDELWSGKNAWGYHLTNLLLHVVNMFLGVCLLKKLYASIVENPMPIEFVAISMALFGIFAFHSEAVFWILCRTASLSLFFNLLSWLCFFKALQNKLWNIPFIVFFLLGIFTYESLWVFPFWLLLWYFMLPKTFVEKSAAKFSIRTLWLIFIAYFIFRAKKTGALLGSYEAGDVEHFNPVALIGKTVRLFFRSFLPPIANAKYFVVCCAIVAIILLVIFYFVWKKKKADKFLIFLVLAWLLSYFPYISLGISTHGYESERYLYFPSFFLCAASVYGIFKICQKPYQRYISLALLFLYHGVFFIQSAIDFAKISQSSKLGIEAIKAVPLSKKIVIENLPVYISGVPVFNYGFGDAVAWMAVGRDTTSVNILSKSVYKSGPVFVTIKKDNPVVDTIFFSGNITNDSTMKH